jgi:hypothetical protein
LVEEKVTVMAGAVVDFIVIDDLVQGRPAEGITELIEEHREPMCQLGTRGDRSASRRGARSRPDENLLPIRGNERTQHAPESKAHFSKWLLIRSSTVRLATSFRQ